MLFTPSTSPLDVFPLQQYVCSDKCLVISIRCALMGRKINRLNRVLKGSTFRKINGPWNSKTTTPGVVVIVCISICTLLSWQVGFDKYTSESGTWYFRLNPGLHKTNNTRLLLITINVFDYIQYVLTL